MNKKFSLIPSDSFDKIRRVLADPDRQMLVHLKFKSSINFKISGAVPLILL